LDPLPDSVNLSARCAITARAVNLVMSRRGAQTRNVARESETARTYAMLSSWCASLATASADWLAVSLTDTA